jgi:heat shock protein HslJ
MKVVAGSRFALIALAAVLASCATAGSSGPTLEGSGWQVVAIDGQATPRTDIYQMEFEDGRASGRFGCNRFSGAYTATGTALSLGPTISTKMACTEPANTHERKGFAVLQQEAKLDWSSNDGLTMSNANGSITLERLP